MKLTWRIWLLIFFLILSVITIAPWKAFDTGVVIKSVEKNSSASEQGVHSGEIITSINSIEIKNIQDYTQAIEKIFPSSLNDTIKLNIKTKTNNYYLFVNSPPEITVSDVPKSNIKMGIDLQGGARALVKPEKSLSSSELSDLIAITNNRLNVFGLTDLKVSPVSDLLGNNYMLVEVAGATPSDLNDLIGKQGKFEAKIGNDSVFVGGSKDITSVCRNDATCSRIESCGQIQDGYACRFSFAIYLSEESAKRHANITSSLKVVPGQDRYLDKKLDLLVDDSIVDSLFISEDLKGRITTQISVSGSGTGVSQEEAYKAAQEQMHKLQTILITGSLPYKLNIVKLDTISPVLGNQFIFAIILAGVCSMIAVGIIIFIRYRQFKSSLAILFTGFSEIILILGMAAFSKWNLDLPSIAGILGTIGTGIDQQIIILDESKHGKSITIKEKLKRALFIIVSSYLTAVVSLFPLFRAGGGLLKGFALTTLLGITIGVLITRPAFADILRELDNSK